MITKEQSAAARAMLGLSQVELGAKAGLSESTIRNFEKGRGKPPSDKALGAIRASLEKAGVEFIPENGGGAGVRLAKKSKGKK